MRFYCTILRFIAVEKAAEAAFLLCLTARFIDESGDVLFRLSAVPGSSLQERAAHHLS
jgi:hypothetical protein